MSSKLKFYPLKQYLYLQRLTALYFLLIFSLIIPYSLELFSSAGMLADPSLNFTYGYMLFTLQELPPWTTYFFPFVQMIFAFCLMLGKFVKISSLGLWFGLLLLFHSNNLIAHPGLPFLGWLLLSFILIPTVQQEQQNWHMPKLLYFGAWLILASGYSASGIHKILYSPSWLDGSAIAYVLSNPIAYDNTLNTLLIALPSVWLNGLTWLTLFAEVMFLPLVIFRLGRKYIWLLMTLIHLGIFATISFPELTVSILLFHLFVFDARWLLFAEEKLIVSNLLEYLRKRYLNFLLAIAIGLIWASAFISQQPLFAASMGILVCLIVAYVLEENKLNKFELLILALVGHLLAFNWVADTFTRYSQMHVIISSLILVLLSIYSAMQFVFLHVVFNKLNFSFFKKYSLALPVAWLSLEMLYYRPLPWIHGHTQLGNIYLAQLADIAGPVLISFVLFWWASLLINFYKSKTFSLLIVFLVSFVLAVSYGVYRVKTVDEASKQVESIRVGIVQGNTDPVRIPDEQTIMAQIADYLNRSSLLYQNEKPELILWPESAVDSAFFYGTEQIEPNFGLENNPIETVTLFGGVTIAAHGTDRFAYYNSAYLLNTSGKVLDEYYKTLPFPFGEAYPLEDYLPALKKLSNKHALLLLKNHDPRPIHVNLGENKKLLLATVICFESIAAYLVRKLSDSTQPGMIIELSNHAWFGRSIVSYQHHLLSAWRAIENRQYMVRVSNAGYSNVIDPVGRVVFSMPKFKPAEATVEVRPLNIMSPYDVWGDRPLFILALCGLLIFFLRVIFLFFIRLESSRKWGKVATHNLN